MIMSKRDPVPQNLAQNAIGSVFGLCAAIAVMAVNPPFVFILALLTGIAGVGLGWTIALIPYYLSRK